MSKQKAYLFEFVADSKCTFTPLDSGCDRCLLRQVVCSGPLAPQADKTRREAPRRQLEKWSVDEPLLPRLLEYIDPGRSKEGVIKLVKEIIGEGLIPEFWMDVFERNPLVTRPPTASDVSRGGDLERDLEML